MFRERLAALSDDFTSFSVNNQFSIYVPLTINHPCDLAPPPCSSMEIISIDGFNSEVFPARRAMPDFQFVFYFDRLVEVHLIRPARASAIGAGRPTLVAFIRRQN